MTFLAIAPSAPPALRGLARVDAAQRVAEPRVQRLEERAPVKDHDDVAILGGECARNARERVGARLVLDEPRHHPRVVWLAVALELRGGATRVAQEAHLHLVRQALDAVRDDGTGHPLDGATQPVVALGCRGQPDYTRMVTRLVKDEGGHLRKGTKGTSRARGGAAGRARRWRRGAK